MAFTDITSMMGGRSWNGAAIGASLGGGMRQSKLGQLANAYANAGDPAAQKTAIQNATAFDPETGAELQGKMDTQQKEARAKAGQAAKYILSAHESGGALAASKAYKEVLPWLSEAAKTHGAVAPPDWDENSMLENVRGLAAMDGGGDESQRGILANDGNIVDPKTGRVIYQGSPKPQYEIVTDPQTGAVYRVPKTPGAAEQVMLGVQPQASGQSQQGAMTGAGASVPMDAYANAIAGIESAGSGDYSALGPATKNGDRALGRYQVMGANIPQWTLAALGKSMSPQEYLANPQAQDAVFKHRFGKYVEKYGPEGAAKAWFAGEGGMNNPNAKDSLGTSVTDYARKFAGGLGQSGGQPLRLSPKAEKKDAPAGYKWDETGTKLAPIEGGPADFKQRDAAAKRAAAAAKRATDAANRARNGGASPKTSEGERNAAGFYDRMVEANAILDKLDKDGYDPTNVRDVLTVGGVLNPAASSKGQQYHQAAMNWVRANLRKESGAAIGIDEAKAEIANYFPKFGDSKETVEQKAHMRKTVEGAMRKAAGNAMPQAGGNAPSSGKYTIGQIVEHGGKRYRVVDNSDPNDPELEEAN